MGGPYSTYEGEERRGAYTLLVVKPERTKPLGRPKHRREDNIKMFFQEAG